MYGIIFLQYKPVIEYVLNTKDYFDFEVEYQIHIGRSQSGWVGGASRVKGDSRPARITKNSIYSVSKAESKEGGNNTQPQIIGS